MTTTVRELYTITTQENKYLFFSEKLEIKLFSPSDCTHDDPRRGGSGRDPEVEL